MGALRVDLPPPLEKKESNVREQIISDDERPESKASPFRVPRYSSPLVQVIIVAFAFFLLPGMFNSLTGIGGSGQIDHTATNDANMALYATFSAVGFFAGAIINVLGIKTTLCLGGLGYCVYIAALLCYSHTKNYGFMVFSGAYLGLSGALLWTAADTIIMSYPPRESKGRYTGCFWMIFSMGAVVGSFIPLGQNIHVKENKTVSDGTYIGYLISTVLGTALTWTLADARKVVREDGSRIILAKNPSWQTELLWLCKTFRTDTYIVLFFPMFFASNWFYTYIFNDVNGAEFNTRTRALNNTLYYVVEVASAVVIGHCLDRPWVKRTTRARIMWLFLFSLTMALWGSSYYLQHGYKREEVTAGKGFTPMDWEDAGYIGHMFLYMSYGLYDAAWQAFVYWSMGSLTNNARKLANFAGFYKGIQSAGAAIAWRLDNLGTPYVNMLVSCWALLGGSLLIALPVILFKVKNELEEEEDLFAINEEAQVAVVSDHEGKTETDMGEVV